jgi:chemotaxis response regulator CheB
MQQQAIGSFIDYLDRRSRVPVRALDPGETLLKGVCYVHPASVPVELVREGAGISARILSDLPGDRVLEHFLISASKVMGKNLVTLLLSGGSDKGIDGLRAVKQVEGVTLAQDPVSSVDPRMAEAALDEGVVDHKCNADNLADFFQDLVKKLSSEA